MVAAPDDLHRRRPEGAEVGVLASKSGGVVSDAGGEVLDALQDLAWLQQATGERGEVEPEVGSAVLGFRPWYTLKPSM